MGFMDQVIRFQVVSNEKIHTDQNQQNERPPTIQWSRDFVH